MEAPRNDGGGGAFYTATYAKHYVLEGFSYEYDSVGPVGTATLGGAVGRPHWEDIIVKFFFSLCWMWSISLLSPMK